MTVELALTPYQQQSLDILADAVTRIAAAVSEPFSSDRWELQLTVVSGSGPARPPDDAWDDPDRPNPNPWVYVSLTSGSYSGVCVLWARRKVEPTSTSENG